MIKSMTGFGKAVCELPNKKITVEIKSLNSKQLDLNLKIPSQYKEKEHEVRNMIAQSLQRGKVDFAIYFDKAEGDDNFTKINEPIVKAYYNQLKKIAGDLQAGGNEPLLQIAMRMPDALKTEKEEIDETLWGKMLECTKLSVGYLDDFRIQEGQALQKDIEKRLGLIGEYLVSISQFEGKRIETLKARFRQSLKDYFESETIDHNRFEQELIYYIEKIDITEEKVRLKNHLQYFLQVMNEDGESGRKMGFVAQEIGREINTIGSKANDSSIQKLVVQMKDELEKIKEQLMNVL
jgi:uncharacterized protein (TIGR00255 family)